MSCRPFSFSCCPLFTVLIFVWGEKLPPIFYPLTRWKTSPQRNSLNCSLFDPNHFQHETVAASMWFFLWVRCCEYAKLLKQFLKALVCLGIAGLVVNAHSVSPVNLPARSLPCLVWRRIFWMSSVPLWNKYYFVVNKYMQYIERYDFPSYWGSRTLYSMYLINCQLPPSLFSAVVQLTFTSVCGHWPPRPFAVAAVFRCGRLPSRPHWNIM